MNKAEIRDAVRTITELDTSDVSNSTIDLYIKDGYDRIVSLERRWPFFEASSSLTTVAGVREYSVDSVGTGDFRELTSLVSSSEGVRLRLISYDQGEQAFLVDAADPSGVPQYWSVWGGNIQLWPKPASEYTLLVRGYRQPNSWHESEGEEVDADERLHRALVYYTTAQLYQLQEDVEMSSFYRNTFEEAVRLAKADIMRVPSHSPLVLSGGDPKWGNGFPHRVAWSL